MIAGLLLLLSYACLFFFFLNSSLLKKCFFLVLFLIYLLSLSLNKSWIKQGWFVASVHHCFSISYLLLTPKDLPWFSSWGKASPDCLPANLCSFERLFCHLMAFFRGFDCLKYLLHVFALSNWLCSLFVVCCSYRTKPYRQDCPWTWNPPASAFQWLRF